MKILHVNSYFNGSSFYKNLYDNQILKGEKISVYVPIPKGKEETIENFGGYSVVSAAFYSVERYSFFLKSYHIFKDLQSKLDIRNYDLIHAHSLFTNGYIAYKMKKRYGIPYIVAVRNTDLNVFFKKAFHLRSLGMKIINNSEKTIFLSSAYKEIVINKYIPKELRDTIAEKSIIIPNGVDSFWLNHKHINKFFNQEEIIKLIAVGNISTNKNIETSMKAVDILWEKGIKTHLTVVGRVKNEEIFKRILENDKVTYYRFMEKEKLINLYRENHIFVLPSRKETFGNVYLEALSQSLPVIYTRNQGFDRQFKEGVIGYSVDPDNPAEIAQKIIEIIKNYKLISKTASTKADLYDWKLITNQYSQIYKNIL